MMLVPKLPLPFLVLVLVLLVQHGSSFPSFLLNSCSRSLTVGEVIMNLAVLPSSSAPAERDHSITVLNAASEVACGSTVVQGEELTIDVDPNLIALVGAEGWTEGQGPNYIIDAQGGLVETGSAEMDARGCDNSRIVNPDSAVKLYPLVPGDLTVRLLSAYSFGQVYASEECTMVVTGSREVVAVAGFLVDNASWEANESSLSSEPYALTVGELISGESSGYAILEETTDGTFALKYKLDEAGNSKVAQWLQSMTDTARANLQVTILGFQSDDGTSVDVLTLDECASASTCDGYYSVAVVGDQVCIADGLCIQSAIVDESEGTMTTTITSDDESWFGIGFSTPGGGMTGGGAGADIFVCSSEGLRRFFVTSKTNPESSPDVEVIAEDSPSDDVIKNICVFEAGTGKMTFTRSLEGRRPILLNEEQSIIWARGAGEQALATRHDRRGEVSIDLTNLSEGVTSVKQTAPWILWLHVILMAVAWALVLPMGAAIANRTRNVIGASPGAWFTWHKSLGRIGWTLQLLGLVFGVYYCEVYSDHLQHNHTVLGLAVVVAGSLQPISAVFRPHPPKGGWPDGKKPVSRLSFELVHKSMGWFAIVAGTANVFVGANLVNDLDFEDSTTYVPIAIGAFGVACFLIFIICGLVSPNNPISKAITGSKSAN